MALGQAMAYQELLNEADAKLKLDAVALPTKPMLVKKQGCMKGAGAKISADPSCSCKIKGNCAKFSFPGAVLHGSSKDLSSGVISDYINQTYSGSEGARLSGDAVRRNAAATKQSIDEVKTTIVQQRKDMGFKNTQIENNSNLIASSIRADARRSAAAAIPTNTRSGRWARILALEEKTAPEKVAAAVAAVTSSTRAAQRIAKRKPAKPGEMEILSIEEGGTPTGEELEIGGIELSEMPKTKAKAEVGKAAPEEKPAGIEFDPSKTLWKIITKRYQNSAFPRLLKMKKVEK
jgi:hypothetical protein